MRPLRIQFIGPNEYETFVDLKESELAHEVLLDAPTRKIIRGNWYGQGVFVQWDEDKKRGIMRQVCGVADDKEFRKRIAQGDFSMFDECGHEEV